MSHDNGNGSQKSGAAHGTHTITASKGGGAGKWLLGGLAALVIAGGGYAAYKYYGAPNPPTSQVADNQATQSGQQPSYAGPLPSDQAGQPPADTSSSEAAPPAQTASNTPARTRHGAHAAVTEEAVVGVTPASVTDQSEEVIVRPARRPVWARTPSSATLTAFYPERALERGREGEASVHCMVRNSGKMDCVQVSETPLHQGFGDAAVRVARQFRHAPQRADGSPAPGTPVNLRVVFRMAEENDRRG